MGGSRGGDDDGGGGGRAAVTHDSDVGDGRCCPWNRSSLARGVAVGGPLCLFLAILFNVSILLLSL